MTSPMRRIVVIGACLALTGLVDGAGAAPGDKPGRGPAALAGSESGAVRGVVKSVGGARLVLETNQSGPAGSVAFALDDKTVVQRLGKTLTVKDLKVGDSVTASYVVQDGKAVAQRVWVRSTAAPSEAPVRRGSIPAGR